MQADRPNDALPHTRIDDVVFTLCLSAFAAAMTVFAGSAAAAGPSGMHEAAGATHGKAPAGTFTGSYVKGAPVYRLPPVTVSARRAAEIARIKREDEQTDASAAAAGGNSQPREATQGVKPSA
jgi:hypothetical protein